MQDLEAASPNQNVVDRVAFALQPELVPVDSQNLANGSQDEEE